MTPEETVLSQKIEIMGLKQKLKLIEKVINDYNVKSEDIITDLQILIEGWNEGIRTNTYQRLYFKYYEDKR